MPRPKLIAPLDVIPLLGVLSDGEVASRAGVSLPVVRRWREERGLKPSGAGRGIRVKADSPCPAEVLPLLGEWSAIRLSHTFRVSPRTIQRWRELHGVSGEGAGKPGRPLKPVPPHLEAQVGVIPDHLLAQEASVSLTLARRWREALGLPLVPVKRHRKAMFPEALRTGIESRYPGIAPLLGTMTDADVGRKYGITRECVRQFRARLGIPSFFTPVSDEAILAVPGTVSVTVVAKALHTTPLRVRAVREANGIVTRTPNQVALDSVRHLLGTMSDSKIVARAPGLSLSIVQLERVRLGIPPHSLSPRCAGFVKIDRKRARELYLEGLNDEEVAAVLGSTKSSMRAIRLRELDILYGKNKPMRLRESTSG